jgi:hypothetical protein
MLTNDKTRKKAKISVMNTESKKKLRRDREGKR